MPSKVNPVITEMISQVSFQVISSDQAITLAAFSGQLELNAFLPLITFNLLTSLKLLTNCVTLFRTHCVEGINANPERCSKWLEESLCLATALAPYIGYDKAAELSKQAAAHGKTIRQMALEEGLFTMDELDIIFSPQELTRPGIAGLRKLKNRKKGNN
jgi:aspartate ammonia-lyase